MIAFVKRLGLCLFVLVSLGGCAVVSVVDTAASVTGSVVKTGVDVATAPIDLLVGDDDDDEDEEQADE